ncbi:MAG: hypothetical protein Q9181_006275 [Wetmoreana brouardii]
MAAVTGQRHDRYAAVVYGSETGNALDYAEEAGRLLERLHFSSVVAKLDDLDPASLAHFDFVIAVISTTGQGDLPANARSFWTKLLRKRLPPKYLEKVHFTTFGLGDSSYPKYAAPAMRHRTERFNWAARKLHKRLLQLGANEVCPRGEADEQHDEGLDAAWVLWSMDLRQQILAKYPLDEGANPISDHVLLQPKWLLAATSGSLLAGTDRICNGGHGIPSVDGVPILNGTPPKHAAGHPPYADIKNRNSCHLVVQIEENKRLTPPSHWQDVRQLHFTSVETIGYEPGDVLTIYPQNSSEDVDQILTLMGWADHADQPLALESTAKVDAVDLYPPPLVTTKRHNEPFTLRKLLTHHLDIRAIPRRSFFSMIAHFTYNRMHKERLLEFTDPKYIDELYDYTTRPRRSILEVLQEFDSVKIPWQRAADVFPELRGRQFSIASGGSRKQTCEGRTSFELLVAIVKYRTVIRRLREGVCTRYLAGLPVGTEIAVTLQKGGLNIQRAEAGRPVIMIGPGTGVAPIRSLIWERYHWHQSGLGAEHHTGSDGVGESVFFYGCRNQEADFFYREEWNELKGKIPLQVFTAFSRDQAAKVYVQDVLKQQSKLVYDLLYSKRGLVYVCGSSGKMPQAVRAALIDIFRSCGQMEEPAANNYLQCMEKEGRYKQETW